MKYSVAFLATVASLAAAIDPADYFPACSLGPLSDAVLSATTCPIDDYACQCTPSNQASIQGAAAADVIDACGVDVAINDVLPSAAEFCAAVTGG